MAPQSILMVLLLVTSLASGSIGVFPTEDPLLDAQWQEEFSGISALRATGADGSGITIGIVDGGFDRSHPEFLTTDLLYLSPATGSPFDVAHGTAVLGVISAGENGVGGVGIAPRARVLARASARGDEGLLIDYLEDLADRGARVINLSLSYDRSVTGVSLEEAYETLRDRGVLVIAAAGNSGFGDNRIYPSRLPSVLSIGSHDQSGDWSDFSVRTGVTISGPGESIVVPSSGGGYDIEGGTSFSAPVVTGTIAALMSKAPSLDSEAIVALLLESAARSPDGPLRLDAAAAINLLQSERPIARFTQLPSLPKTSLSQLVSIRVGRVAIDTPCRIEISLGERRTGDLPCAPVRTTLGALLERLGAHQRSGSVRLSLVLSGQVYDTGSVAFDLDLAPYDPEPDDRLAPRVTLPLDTPWISREDRSGYTEVRFTDNRPLRGGGIFCDSVDARFRDAGGSFTAWSRQIDTTTNLPYEIEGGSLRLRLPSLPAEAPGRLEWRVDCSDISGNRSETVIATVAVPLEGESLVWGAGHARIIAPSARDGDLSISSVVGATIRWSSYGRRLALIAPTGEGFGRFELVIDDRDRCIVDLERRADGSPREARSRAVVLGPGDRCGETRLGSLSDVSTLHRVTLRILPSPNNAPVPIDAIALW